MSIARPVAGSAAASSLRLSVSPSLLFLLLAALAFASVAAAASRPNVIVILTDDQGYGDVSYHGSPILKTPNLDRLASESIRLTDFHVAPMCTATRGQLMTGRDALRNGAMNVSSGRTLLRLGQVTMAELFRDAGYRTGQFGKWHLGDNHPFRPQDRGFEETLWHPSSHIPSAPDHWLNDYFDDVYRHNGVKKRFEGYCADVFFDEAMKWMKRKQDDGEPFFTYIATNTPHSPNWVEQKYRDPYTKLPHHVASYYGMIANFDHNMGRLEKFLADSGLRDDTLVIFMTDNGGTSGVPIFNAGMRGGKITYWDGGHRTPCFLRWPNGPLEGPRTIDELTCVTDILPTLAEVCGLDRSHDDEFDGTTLGPLLRGETDRLDDRMLVIQYSRMNMPRPAYGDAAVLWRKWRLVENEGLYDIRNDPGQQENVIADFPGVAHRMRSHYEQWWAGIEPNLNDFEAVSLGHPDENPTMLSPCEWADVFLDQAAQVFRGLRRNGLWHVEVAEAGTYSFELRRWPVEADLPMRAAVPATKLADGIMPPGVSLPIHGAKIEIADIADSAEVGESDKAVTFVMNLPAGRTTLRTAFTDSAGEELCGAYFVYVERQ